VKPGWIYVTTKDEAEAEAIADVLVSQNMSGCVNIIPKIRSVYRWQGQIQHDTEACMLIKTNLLRFEEIRQKIRSLHSYESPCIIAIDWTGSDTDFLKWLLHSTIKNPN
jgi:periplasmic divalent cation tolerance protein